jgi:hypothetical protein
VFIFLTPNAHNPLTLLMRLLRPAQAVLVRRLYGRVEADTFPVAYRANTRRDLIRAAEGSGLRLVALDPIADPSYVAFTPLFYHVGALLSRLSPAWLRVHLVGVCRKDGGQSAQHGQKPNKGAG